jgi:NADPH-dependent glutamate synthase beta subunit-like oxidoreductase
MRPGENSWRRLFLRFKTNREASVAEQPELQTKEIALEDELRIGQAKFDRLEKALEISETVPRKPRAFSRPMESGATRS